MALPVVFRDIKHCKLQEIRVFDYTISDGSKTFEITYVFEPHRRSSPTYKAAVHEIIGDGICLGITQEDVKNNINGSSYNLVARARDKSADDTAICTVQLRDWCLDAGYPPQLWINDLCRLSTLPKESRTEPSPVAVLLEQVEALIASVGIDSTWFLIDKKKTNTHNPNILLKRYNNQYGYKLIGEGSGTPPCSLSETDRAVYYVMRKQLTVATSPATTGGGSAAPFSSKGL